jgi:HK97 family phage major capsid protein
METFTTAVLKTKPSAELWQMRKRIASELENIGEDGRELTADERATEERHISNLRAIDSVLDESFQSDTLRRYDHLGSAQRLSQRDMATVDWVKSAITEKNPAAFIIKPEEERAFTVSQPGLEYRSLWEQRDTTKAAAGGMPVSVYPRFMIALAEMTPVIRAALRSSLPILAKTCFTPRATAFQTGNLIGEAASITESDPTLSAVTLKSYKYAAFWQLSKELVDDSSANILDTLTQTAANALALSYGPHLATSSGGGQPVGYAFAATVGVTGPTGTNGQFGTQGTAGQGSDLLFDLYASIAEPYLLSPSVAVLGRNATFTLWRKYKEGGTNTPMFDLTPVKPGASVNLLGQPGYVDPHIAGAGSNTKSLAFGDFSRYVVRIVQGVKVERSDDFAFQSDLASFKATIRLDANLLDTNAIKTFQHSAT